MPIRRKSLWLSLGLAAVVFAVYAPSARFEFLNYDDPAYIANPHVREGLNPANLKWAFTSVSAANWFPLTWISLMIDRDLFGDRAGMYHFMNVVLHAAGVLLLFAAMRRLTGTVWRSTFVALIFALHPLHLESVAWIAERKDVLSGVFFFAAIWCYAVYAGRPTRARYALLVLAVCAALMSKPTTVTLPVLFLLLDYWPLQRVFNRRLLLEKIPLFALAILASAVTYFAQQSAGAVLATEIPLAMRLENAAVSYAVYLLKFFAPLNLAVFYPYPASIPLWQAAASALLLVAISAGVFYSRRRYLITGWLWFLIALLPMIGLIQVGLQSRADRYTYLPLTGLAIMVAWAAAEIFKPRVLAIAGAAAAVAMALVTAVNLQNWRDSEALFRHAIAVTDGNYVAYNNLGAAVRRSGRIADSIPFFETAIRLHPAYDAAQNNLGEAFIAEKKPEQAEPHIVAALRLNPDLAAAHNNLGTLLNQRRQFADAADQFRIALRLDPDNTDAHFGLGVSLTELGRFADALPQLLEAERADPDAADVHYNLGRLFALAGRPVDAIAEFAEALRLDPGNAETHFNLGTALATQNRLPEAEDQFRAAVRLDPDYRNAHFNLASALAGEGRFAEAIPEFAAVLRLDPNFTDARRALEYCQSQNRQRMLP